MSRTLSSRRPGDPIPPGMLDQSVIDNLAADSVLAAGSEHITSAEIYLELRRFFDRFGEWTLRGDVLTREILARVRESNKADDVRKVECQRNEERSKKEFIRRLAGCDFSRAVRIRPGGLDYRT